MPFTQATPLNVSRNKDASLSVVVLYTGGNAGEDDIKDTITLPAGSVLDTITLRKEIIRRIGNQNDSATFEQSLKLIVNTPIDLTPPQDAEDDLTLRAFAVLRGRERDLAGSVAAGCASEEAHADALAAVQSAYAAAKNEALRARMDTFLRGTF